MVKKHAYYKKIKRSIFKSKARFLSIFSIVFLGAAVFAGLRNTPDIMSISMDHYLDEHRFADLTYMSTLGFSEEDIHSIENIEGVEALRYGYQFDVQTEYQGKYLGMTVYTNDHYDEQMLNAPELIDGRFPTADNECLLDEKIHKEKGLNLNQTIDIFNEQGKKTFTIVGIINDNRYISKIERGTNSLGDGTNAGYIEILSKNNDFLAIPDELYDLRDEKILYNQILVKVKDVVDDNLFSDEYKDAIEVINTKIKSQLSLRMSRLYDDITHNAQIELNQAKEDYQKGQKEYQKSKTIFDTKILEAKIQLTNAKIQLATKESEYLKAVEKMNKESENLPYEIDQLKKQVDEFNKELQKQSSDDHQEIKPGIGDDSQIDISIPDISESLPDIDTSTQIKIDMPDIQKISATLEQISHSLSKASKAMEGFLKMQDASLQIEKAKLEIQNQENKLTLEELKTNQQLEEAKSKLDLASEKLHTAQKAINKIPKGKVYALTRSENIGIMSFDANTQSISSIADVFPLMFFLVSALVSLTTMTRMVEEQRSQSGTLRALGYSKWDVIKQYVIYVVLATFIACLLGIVLGTLLFPRIIYYLYTLMLFQVNTETIIVFNTIISLQTIFISVFVTLIVTLSVCISELNLMPAVLMRPKAPKMGKRILLERITFLWKRFSFHQKVTIRNIFRYKKRFFMSIIGIGGCTALIITGFGIKESIAPVVDLQYKDIWAYDALIRLEDPISIEKAIEYEDQIRTRDEITNCEYVLEQSLHIMKNKEDLIGKVVVYQSMDNIANFVSFIDSKTKKTIILDDEGIVLSQKTAELLNVEIDDTIDIELNGIKYNVKVSGITKNYFLHYLYMSQTYYESLTGMELEVNHAFVNMKDLNPSTKTTFEDYMKDHQFGNVSYLSDQGSEFNDQIKSIDMVVIILIVCAGALNFIVLYNLTNINIQERKSEIATIKVLGFRKHEVYNYIFRENIFLSVIGSCLGIVFGYILHQFIIRTVELESTLFVRSLGIKCYIIAIVMTMGFTLFINLTMRHVLNRVNMVESLKSIE